MDDSTTPAESGGDSGGSGWAGTLDDLLTTGINAWSDTQIAKQFAPNDPTYFTTGRGLQVGYPAGQPVPPASTIFASYTPLLIIGAVVIAVVLVARK